MKAFELCNTYCTLCLLAFQNSIPKYFGEARELKGTKFYYRNEPKSKIRFFKPSTRIPRAFEYISQSVTSTPVVQWLSYSPLDPRFAGSIPAGVNWFFQSVKILSMTSFGKEVKPWVPCRRLEIRASEQNLPNFYALCRKRRWWPKMLKSVKPNNNSSQ